MKELLENWNKMLHEVEELSPQNKSKVFQDVTAEANSIINKINSASGGDSGLAKEALESLIVILQDSLERL